MYLDIAKNEYVVIILHGVEVFKDISYWGKGQDPFYSFIHGNVHRGNW